MKITSKFGRQKYNYEWMDGEVDDRYKKKMLIKSLSEFSKILSCAHDLIIRKGICY